MPLLPQLHQYPELQVSFISTLFSASKSPVLQVSSISNTRKNLVFVCIRGEASEILIQDGIRGEALYMLFYICYKYNIRYNIIRQCTKKEIYIIISHNGIFIDYDIHSVNDFNQVILGSSDCYYMHQVTGPHPVRT